MSQNIPESKMARAKVAGVAAAKLGMGEIGHKVKRAFLSPRQQARSKNALDEKNAKILFNALSKLRGTALKIAQLVGMEFELFPAVYTLELQKSFHQVPPLNRVLIRKVMMQELGQSPETLFRTFEATAFAAASLGQVHRAKLFDGTDVAVKVQYPGIGAAIDSDLALVRGLVRKMKDSKIILQTLDEVEARLKEEVDYEIERKNTNWFNQHVTLDGIHIPTVHGNLSARRILTTQHMSGLHLDDWLSTNPSQEQRNAAAQKLYDFFVHSARELQCLHADPNPGNYLFQSDGSIAVIDFGCVRHLSDRFTKIFPQLLMAYLRDDPKALFKAYEDIGMSFEEFEPGIYEDLFRPFGHWVTLPFATDSFDFASNTDYTRRGQELVKCFSQAVDSPDHVAEEFIFFNRTTYGLCKIFERMGANIRLRHHWVDDKENTK